MVWFGPCSRAKISYPLQKRKRTYVSSLSRVESLPAPAARPRPEFGSPARIARDGDAPAWLHGSRVSENARRDAGIAPLHVSDKQRTDAPRLRHGDVRHGGCARQPARAG